MKRIKSGITKNLVFIMITLVTAISCKSPQSNSKRQISTQIDSIISQTIKLPPGTMISVGIVQGEDVFTHHLSYPNEPKPNDTTLYEIASITKVFTGLLSAKAVNESRMEIYDTITNYLTNKNLPSQFEQITIRELLTNSSGLPILLPDISDRLAKPEWETLAPYYNSLRENYTTEDFFNDLRNIPFINTDKNYSYSNIGTNLMGYSLSNIYGQSYEDLLRNKIFIPLRMSHTYIQENQFLPVMGWRNGKNIPNRSASHINADGGIISCVADMNRFIKYNFNTNLPDVKLSHSVISSSDNKGPDMGFYWQINKGQSKTLYHTGGSFGTTSLLIIKPETKNGIFIVTNQAGPIFHDQLRNLAERLLSFQN